MIRIGGLERGWPLVQVVAYTPYALAASLLSLAVVAVLRRWLAALFLLIATAAFILAVGPRGFGSPDAVGHGRVIRVLTLNLDRGRADPGELLRLAASRDTDLIALSELTPEALAGLERAGSDQSYPERVVEPAAGTTGAGILSRWPLGHFERLDTRPIQIVVPVKVPDSIPFDLVAAHPTTPTGPRSTAEWQGDFERLPRAGTRGLPLVLVGDLGATLDHFRLRRLLDTGYRDAGAVTGRGLAFTWPSRIGWPPPITPDHVLAERGIGIAGYDVEPVTGSDHRAVSAELVMPPVP